MSLDTGTSLAHRAIAAAVVLGLLEPRRGLRVTVADLAAEPTEEGATDLFVVTDRGEADERELPGRMARVRASLAASGVLAVVVGSPITRALVAAASADARERAAGREDAYARALTWAAERADDVTLAPALDPQRLRIALDGAAACGLVLVEPEPAGALARVRALKSPRARALLATIALGTAARPLLFVPSPLAPKNGRARAKVERLADGWVTAPSRGGPSEPPLATDLVTAATTILRASALAGEAPMRFGELLRRARDRWAEGARATGSRATPGSADARELAAALHERSAADDVTWFALDPSDPGWVLHVR
jgi:hypothetical protein